MKHVVVGRVAVDHPNGQYTVCECTFTTLPKAFEVTQEQKAQIEADRYVILAQFGSLTWCEAQGIPFTEAELLKLGLDGNAQPLKKAKEAVKEPVKSRKQLLDELKEKGKLEGKDFSKDAKAQDLQALLETA